SGADIPGGIAATLFAESPGRILIAVDPKSVDAIHALAEKFEIPLHKIGASGGDSLIINDAVIPLTELRKAHTETLPRLFGQQAAGENSVS
ncbi:MAG TPA: hypothetical protein VIH79_04030, partial [Candidatus Nanopelagicaceae bacterium]